MTLSQYSRTGIWAGRIPKTQSSRAKPTNQKPKRSKRQEAKFNPRTEVYEEDQYNHLRHKSRDNRGKRSAKRLNFVVSALGERIPRNSLDGDLILQDVDHNPNFDRRFQKSSNYKEAQDVPNFHFNNHHYNQSDSIAVGRNSIDGDLTLHDAPPPTPRPHFGTVYSGGRAIRINLFDGDLTIPDASQPPTPNLPVKNYHQNWKIDKDFFTPGGRRLEQDSINGDLNIQDASQPPTPITPRYRPADADCRQICKWYIEELNKLALPVLDISSYWPSVEQALNHLGYKPHTRALNIPLSAIYNSLAEAKRKFDAVQFDPVSFRDAQSTLAQNLEQRYHLSLPSEFTAKRTQATKVLTGLGKTNNMPPSLLSQFLNLINGTIRSQNGNVLQVLLQIEPPFRADYVKMVDGTFSEFSELDAVKESIRSAMPVTSDGNKDEWSLLPDFLANYFLFVKTVDPSNLLDTYDKLSSLLTKCTAAFQNDLYGIIMLPTILEYSKLLARLAIGLDKQPDLIAHLLVSEEGSTSSLPELAAINLRPIMSICARDTKPNGKAVALYKMANLCMKILFQCNKPESIPNFYNIVGLQRRPITDYNRGERVTYLYYLGRYFYSSAQFHSAMRVLDQAYLECDTSCLKNRRLILVYLVASSIILGRFPNDALYNRPEAVGFKEKFGPICEAMRMGDIATFRLLTSLTSPYADWFLSLGILLQIQGRGEVIVWRSLARRTFALRSITLSTTTATTNAQGGKVAQTLDLRDLHAVARLLAIRALSPIARSDPGIPGKRHTNWALFDDSKPADLPPLYIDPDFEGLSHDELGITKETLPPEVPTLDEVEGMIASLISLGLMSGYISHRLKKFAIKRGKSNSAVQAGWPVVAAVLRDSQENQPIPGLNTTGGGSGGMIIQLSSAAAAGS